MSWIKIQNGLVTNKKTARLARQMKWKKLEAIGFMVSFWIWALENCEDGQLKDISDNEIAFAVGLDSADGILEALKTAGFVDRKPLRIHDWPVYQHEFLRAKHRREPDKHQKIIDLYRYCTGTVPVQTRIERKEGRKIDRQIDTTTTEAAGAADEGLKPINWDNCRTDTQRLLAHYVKLEMPELYRCSTQAQAMGLFKRYGKAASEILSVAGDIDTAKHAFDTGRAFFNKKGLSWNLSTISKNIAEFVNSSMEANNESR